MNLSVLTPFAMPDPFEVCSGWRILFVQNSELDPHFSKCIGGTALDLCSCGYNSCNLKPDYFFFVLFFVTLQLDDFCGDRGAFMSERKHA